MKVAVVGHVEWVSFCALSALPAPGSIVHTSNSWDEAAGGGGVAAAELARLAGEATLFTALGHDHLGDAAIEQLRSHRVHVVAPRRPEPQRRAITLVDNTGERTIVVIGQASEPRADDGFDLGDLDAVYFCKGDAALLRAARSARVLVATARVLPVIREAGVRLDALVHSASDPSERYVAGDLAVAPDLVASTRGARGGHYTLRAGAEGRWDAAPLPGPLQDTYGAGDSFAAGLTWALAAGMGARDAIGFAAARGALALTRRGAHGG